VKNFAKTIDKNKIACYNSYIEGVVIMKTRSFLTFIVAITFSIISCPTGTSPELGNPNTLNTDFGTLEILQKTGIKVLYSGNIILNNSVTSQAMVSRAVTSSVNIQTLSYTDESNAIKPLSFLTSSGKEVILNITETLHISKNMIMIRFTALYEIEIVDIIDSEEIIYKDTQSKTGQVLINMETGKIYDFSDFRSIEYEDGYLVVDETLFAYKSGVIYSIDLNNISLARPLNNPDYFTASLLCFKIGNKLILKNGSLESLSQNPPDQIIKYWIIRRAARQRTAANNTNDTFACPLT
jgi:hypothetical protein